MVMVNSVFWWMGMVFFVVVSIPLVFAIISVLWCWISASYCIWRGYVVTQKMYPHLNVVSEDFRDKYDIFWEFVLLGALTTQYRTMMDYSSSSFENEWFVVDLKGIKPVIRYKIVPLDSFRLKND